MYTQYFSSCYVMYYDKQKIVFIQYVLLLAQCVTLL